VWCVTALETAAAGLKIVASPETFAVEACQEFRGGVSVEVGEAEGVGCYIPSGAEPEEVGERGVGIAGFGGQDGVDGRVCVVDAGCVLGGKLGKVVLEVMSGGAKSWLSISPYLVGNDIAMPCNQVERTVILLQTVVFSVVLVDNRPVSTQLFVNVSNGIQEVSGVGKTVASQRTQIGQLPHTTPDLCDVSSSLLHSRSESNSESHTSLDDADLSRLQENHSKLSLYVQVSLLSADEEIAIGVAECSLLHGCIDGVDVQSHALSQVGVTRTTQSV
jgi:hypothetical protein